MQYWLMKTEPTTFSFDDLLGSPDQTTCWEGVRNYQARNMMRDQMKVGDQVLFYHSSCAEPGVVGIGEVVREGYPDHTAFDPDARYYDDKSDPNKPRWFMVDVHAVRALARNVTLAELKQEPALSDMPLLRKGNRLSVLPVTAAQYEHVLRLERRAP